MACMCRGGVPVYRGLRFHFEKERGTEMRLDTVERVERAGEPEVNEVRSEHADVSAVVDWSQVMEHTTQALLRATILLAGGTARVAGIVASTARLVQGEARRRL